MSSRSFCILATFALIAVMISCGGESPMSPVTKDRVDNESSPTDLRVTSLPRAERQDKIIICHMPPGNIDNAHEINVAVASMIAHVAHGDTLGECTEEISPEACAGACSELSELLDPELVQPCCEARMDCTWTESEVCELSELDELE